MKPKRKRGRPATGQTPRTGLRWAPAGQLAARLAAEAEGITFSEFVRRAAAERIERVAKENPDLARKLNLMDWR